MSVLETKSGRLEVKDGVCFLASWEGVDVILENKRGWL